MLSLDELYELDINPEVAKEAHAQVEKRLADVLDVRKTTEQKAMALFSAYVTVSLALFGVGGTLLRDAAWRGSAWPFIAAGALFVAGAIVLICAVWPVKYAYVGTEPDYWLTRGNIDGGVKTLPYLLVFQTYYHEERLSVSRAANTKKINLLRFAMVIGASGPLLLLIGLKFAASA